MLRASLIASVLGLLASGAPGAAQEATLSKPPLTYVDFIKQLTDLDRLTRLHPGVQAGLASSWDRNGTNVWGANGDAGQYLRVEPDGEAVMMDVDGPGCIYRFWSANPQGLIRIYLDGAEKPTYEWDFNQLFQGNIPPFIKPFVWQRENGRASDCYLPIPFAKHIKITADKKHGQYYQFNYLLFPKDQPVESFRIPLTGLELGRLTDAAIIWAKPGNDPKPRMAGQTTERKTIEIGPGQTVTIADIAGPAMIRAIRLFAASEQRYVWRKLVLKGTWDNAPWPQILSPIGPFFGFDWSTAEYAAVPVGCRDQTAYAYWPMPFKRRGKLEITNHLERMARIVAEVEWAPAPNLPADMTYFYARWRSEPDTTVFDYPFLETAGRGHFVGVAMPIDHPLPGWWGDGDEKVWVDDDDWPRFIGTGSEDYFGDAWGIRYLNGPSWGCSLQTAHRTCNYRWHFMDLIPFEKRMRMTIENYGPNGVGPRGHYEYTSTAFWYQAEVTPPFAQLRGGKFTGGTDPLKKPETLEYGATLFRNLDASVLRTYGRGVPYVLEAEDLLRNMVRNGVGQIITDAGAPYELSRERGVDFGAAQPGGVLAGFVIPVAEPQVYTPEILIAPVEGASDISLEIGGEWVEIAGRPDPATIRLKPVVLDKKEVPAKFVAATAGRAIVDGLRLEPVPRAPRAMEAEEMAVASVSTGAEAPHPSPAMAGVSGGRILEWHASEPGQSMTIRLADAPDVPRVLGVRAMRGPNGGIIQAFVAGQPIGPRFDIYAPEKGPNPSVWPLGLVPAGVRDVEIRIVGKNAAASGFHVGLDYFRWEPQIISADSAPGVWAGVAGVRGCSYEAQMLGPAFSAGHHLWIQPSSPGAQADIEVYIPSAGQYAIAIRYTKSWDYAVIQAELDGKDIGPRVDTYSPEVVLGDTVALGQVNLAAGRHILRLKAVDKNENSRGYLMGVDDLIVKSVP
ncbi:MAG: DUF2961 domain-containing protein [Chthonomonadales bacterium]|nr:DUF2961 domain-containing protein [Chthonomonadales bacterium]